MKKGQAVDNGDEVLLRNIQMDGSDTRMDSGPDVFDWINPLPASCPVCGFPDLTHVPQPYFLIKSRTRSSNELAPAAYGNFFVTSRVRAVLDAVTPGACEFYPTVYRGTEERTAWTLAVPRQCVETGRVIKTIPTCPGCHQPVSAHIGTQYEKWNWGKQSSHDIAKSSNWVSSEKSWKQWIDVELVFSVRLYRLLKELKAEGLVETACRGETKPLPEEQAWVKEQLEVLARKGIAKLPEGAIAAADLRWFKDYLKANASDGGAGDVAGFEKKNRLKLPPSYTDFISKVAGKTFANVDGQEGVTVHVLSPADWDAQRYKTGMINADERSNAVNRVMFARTDHGDCFCFDVQQDRKEYAVYLYKHEGNFFEPYANNFVQCLRRWAER